MRVEDKAELVSDAVVAFSGLGMVLHYTNNVITTYMPTITAVGIIGGFTLSIWFKVQQIKQKKRDRALWHKKMEHELYMVKHFHQRHDDFPKLGDDDEHPVDPRTPTE